MKKRQIIFNIIGGIALVLCCVLFVVAGNHDRIFNKDLYNYEVENTENDIHGFFRISGELTYEGIGSLDLMSGVSADDGTGNDVTDQVTAIITANSSMTRKTVNYSFVDAGGNTVSEKRQLLMKKYKGPSVKAAETISLNASELNNIINILKERGELSAIDGYGNDITSKVTCIREKTAENVYNVKFTVVNSYNDSDTVISEMIVKGPVKDPSIELSADNIEVKKGDNFDPFMMVERAFDGNTENISLLKIDSSVDTEVPGRYRVVYSMYSEDKTSIAQAFLIVNVTGD